MPLFLIFFLNTIPVIVSYSAMVWLVTKTVPMRAPERFIFISTSVEFVLWTICNFLLPNPESLIDLVGTAVQVVLAVSFTQKGHRKMAVAAVLIYLATQMIISLILLLVVASISQTLNILEQSMDPLTLPYVLMSMITGALVIPAMIVVQKLLTRSSFGLSRYHLLLLPVPMSQIMLSSLVARLVPSSSNPKNSALTFALALLLCIVADICYFLCLNQIRKSDLMKEQLKSVKEQLDTQVQYYQQLQENLLSVNRIRHDLNNQLLAAYQLIEQGEVQPVRQQLDNLRQQIERHVGPRYSGNLMADAVLSEKAERCREKGIALNITVEIPRELPVENAHLCSVLSNLLDNAICGTEESGSSHPVITLDSRIQGNYLTIRCINTAAAGAQNPPKNKDPLRRHGLGLDILEYLAGQYNGTLTVQTDNDQFSTTVILQII